MGADFLFQIVPLCKATPERRLALRKLVNDLPADEKDQILCDMGYDCDDPKFHEALPMIADDYWQLDCRRDVGFLQLSSAGIQHLITGGMSFGDSPTESFDAMSKIAEIECLYSQLEQWAHQDVATEHGIK